MCGLAGLFGLGDEKALSRMVSLLSHRGPDGEGQIWFPELKAGLAHRRLAIIDPSPRANQPLSDESKNIWLILNGEIFNFLELRKELELHGYKFQTRSDTEVLLRAYQVWGEACLEKINGMFAFAIIDRSQKKLLAARDRLGIKPFYYCQFDDGFIFASEIKAIKASKLVSLEPDYEILRNPTRYLISPYTGFRNIKKLPAGHYLIFQDGKLSIKKFWDIQPSEENLPEKEAVEKLDELLQEAVKLQLISDRPLGLLLSGGLDSSLIAALMKQKTNSHLTSFTISFRSQDKKFEAMPDDSYYARQVAKIFNFHHQEREISPDVVSLLPQLVWHMDEPLADPAAINLYLLAREARQQGLVVLLSGMAGDEIFGGYRRQLALWQAHRFRLLLPEWLHSPINSALRLFPVATQKRGIRFVRWLKRFLSFAFIDDVEKYLLSDLSLGRQAFARFFGPEFDYEENPLIKLIKDYQQRPGLSELTKICLMDTKIFLPDHNFTYTDKASMAAGVEIRPPLADHRLVEFMFRLGPQFRIKGNKQKYLLKQVAKKYLPPQIVNRPKAPFGSPLRSWIRRELKEMVDDLLSEETIKKRGLLNPKEVRKIIEEDRRGQEDYSLLIWTFLTWEIWFRTFFS